jgi:hypothetical protein
MKHMPNDHLSPNPELQNDNMFHRQILKSSKLLPVWFLIEQGTSCSESPPEQITSLNPQPYKERWPSAMRFINAG